MRRQFRLLGVAAVAALTAGGLSGCFPAPEKSYTDDDTLSGKVASVRLDDISGSVTLHGSSDATEVRVHREVKRVGKRRPGTNHRIEPDGTLVLSGCGHRCTVDYTVDLPAGLPVTGDLSNGAIGLTRTGDVRVSTGNGRIDLAEIAGAVDVRTGNGRIEGRGLAGDRIRARTSNGAVDLGATVPQEVRITTSNGTIDLTVPKGDYRVYAQARNGRKAIDLPRVPDDPSTAHALDLTTGNGSITVKRG